MKKQLNCVDKVSSQRSNCEANNVTFIFMVSQKIRLISFSLSMLLCSTVLKKKKKSFSSSLCAQFFCGSKPLGTFSFSKTKAETDPLKTEAECMKQWCRRLLGASITRQLAEGYYWHSHRHKWVTYFSFLLFIADEPQCDIWTAFEMWH